MRHNTVLLAKASNQTEFELLNGGIGLDVIHTGDRVLFETTQAGARVTDLAVGDAVEIVAMGDNGALGQGSHYWATVEEIDPDHGLAWLGPVKG